MSQKVKLLLYSDENYEVQRKRLEQVAKESGVFDEIIIKTRKDLEQTQYYKAFKHIFDKKRGAGYWLWKPYYMFMTLLKMEMDDILVYMDCGDKLTETADLREFLISRMKDTDMLLTDGAFRNAEWTKRDCFVRMDCDTPEYHNHIQMEAGIVVIKRTVNTYMLLGKWMNACEDEKILTDIENTCDKPNLDGFKDHRHDQSVLTNLKIKFNIASSNEMRKYIHCNQNND